jgi:hypothetical protein
MKLGSSKFGCGRRSGIRQNSLLSGKRNSGEFRYNPLAHAPLNLELLKLECSAFAMS